MVSFQLVHGRGVRVKRVASLCGVGILSLIFAGCSAPNQRMGYYGDSGTTGSVPIPSEPVYGFGHKNGYGGQGVYTSSSGYYGSSAYSRASDYGKAYHRTSGSRAPFSTGGYSDYAKTSVQRTALAPVSADASYAGNYYAMQPVSDTTASSGGGGFQRVAYDYRSKNDGYAHDARYDRRYGGERDTRRYQSAAERGEYEVEAGDTLYSIAQRFHMTTDELMDLNGLNGPDIHPGQRLRLSRTSGAAPARQRQRSYRDGRGYANSYDNERYQRGYDADRNYSSRRGYSDGDDRYGDSSGNGYDKGDNSYANRGGAYDDEQNGYAGRRDSYTGERRRYSRPVRGARRRPPVSENEEYRGRRDRGPSISYSVKRGDTLFDIARRNGISHRELADYNDIPVTATLYPGQVLHIPRGRGYDWGAGRAYDGRRDESSDRRGKPKVAQREPKKARVRLGSVRRDPRSERPMTAASVRSDDVAVTGGPGTRTASTRGAPSQIVAAAHQESSAHAAPDGDARTASRECESLLANPAQRTARTFREPVQAAIVSKFGAKADGSFNDGINFSVPKGTAVKAAENGVVAYAGNELAGFGNLILVRHADGFVTAYAHNDKLLVRRCDVVKRGQTISKAGATGNATKPQLHFELRRDSKPVDPEAYFSKS